LPSLSKDPNTWAEMDFMRKEALDKIDGEIEKLYLNNLLKKFDGNISHAAISIG